MRVLIVEDETLIAENLAMIVESCGFEVAGFAESESTFLKATEDCEIDLALLDIRMHGVDLGLKFGELLREAGVPFIFITSFFDRDILMRATSLRPYGFILKPFSRTDIAKELRRLSQELSRDFIVFKTGSSTQVKVAKADICYMNSENVYVNVFTDTDRIVVRAKLADLCASFRDNELVRVHQSYAINPKFVKRFSDTEIQLYNDVLIPVSRKYQYIVKVVLKSI